MLEQSTRLRRSVCLVLSVCRLVRRYPSSRSVKSVRSASELETRSISSFHTGALHGDRDRDHAASQVRHLPTHTAPEHDYGARAHSACLESGLTANNVP